MPGVPKTKCWIRKDFLADAMRNIDELAPPLRREYARACAEIVVRRCKQGKDNIDAVARFILNEWLHHKGAF